MEKVKILGIWHNTHNKKGQEYISKNGKPYELCSIKDSKGYISGFGNQTTNAWKVGDEIEIEITPNGNFRNFKLPAKEITRLEFNNLAFEIKALEMRVEKLEEKFEKPIDEQIDEVFGSTPPEEDNQ